MTLRRRSSSCPGKGCRSAADCWSRGGNDRCDRVAEALRLTAQTLWQAKNYFGELYRRGKVRLGAPKAITAMAHT
ncbi:MAG TPA: hypothetical protein PKN95_15460 [Verrucomicrobiota bacterium]|nr:hypothetical protein [Verrucomicrobiota bacterium]